MNLMNDSPITPLDKLDLMIETVERNTGETPTRLVVSAQMFDDLIARYGQHRVVTVFYRGNDIPIIRESEENANRTRARHAISTAAAREKYAAAKRQEELPHIVWGTKK